LARSHIFFLAAKIVRLQPWQFHREKDFAAVSKLKALPTRLIKLSQAQGLSDQLSGYQAGRFGKPGPIQLVRLAGKVKHFINASA
jgi:hypothetical protein